MLAQTPDRQVANTIDDLPAAGAKSKDAAAITEMTSKLLTTLRNHKAPAVGFVNEKKLYKFGEVDERIRALRLWLDYRFLTQQSHVQSLFPQSSALALAASMFHQSANFTEEVNGVG